MKGLVFGSLLAVTGFGGWLSFVVSERTAIKEQNLGFALFEIDKNVPTSKAIQNAGEDTFGYFFKHHFVDASNGENEEWWKWAYKNRYQFARIAFNSSDGYLSEEFKSVNDHNSLKSSCEKVYKKKLKTHDVDESSVIQKEEINLLEEIWLYCSTEGIFPITVEEDYEWDQEEEEEKDNNIHDTEEKINPNYQSRLVAISGNEKFWNNHAKTFFKQDVGKGSGNKATESEAGFSELYKKTGGDRTVKELKELCGRNYEKFREASSKDKIIKETIMFCSLRSFE
ncbi:hypothetical protein MHSWG343_10700 [Candidatus Mycoplasma haematohominis]|uniref:Uncharacterized protein n=1 Tax=Candidatus Mycoplasma haematohominis TaxID=1494318 RepID=A0A478FRK7_9MOLU|nr:hypothetical protein MHSWG343_10700 [Candidatus Mycoplasma haemohominis]